MRVFSVGDIVTPRVAKDSCDSIAVYERAGKIGPNHEGFWSPIGYVRRGEIFIILEVRDSMQWRDGVLLIQNPSSGLAGWCGGQFFKRVR